MLNLGYDARIEFKPLKILLKFKTWNSGHLGLLNYMLKNTLKKKYTDQLLVLT